MQLEILGGKSLYSGVTLDTPMSSLIFHQVDMSWNESNDIQLALHTNLGSLTVLDRLTGYYSYSGRIRDTETGYREPDGTFWLASGGVNLLEELEGKTWIDAVDFVKVRSNTCMPPERREWIKTKS